LYLCQVKLWIKRCLKVRKPLALAIAVIKE
jgi:hypothetical protein